MTAKSEPRFKGLMGGPGDAAAKKDQPVVSVVPDPAAAPAAAAPASVPASTTAPAARPDPQEKKSRAKVQLNTQQPEDLKNAADKAAAYLSFTSGKKITTTEVVERALRAYLETLPPEATATN